MLTSVHAAGQASENRPRLRHNARMPTPLPARVVVLAGPSGSGKTRLARQTGLPVLRLDDYYRTGDDPALPRIEYGANAGLVDWDDPRSWHCDEAVRAICELAATGRTVAPVYDIARNGPSGTHEVELHGSALFVAEGIFAQEVVAECVRRGLLADAICVTQHPVLTFVRRLTRDLREHRKPPLVLVRRGVHLMREQRRVVEHAASLGCRVVHPEVAYTEITRLVGRRPA